MANFNMNEVWLFLRNNPDYPRSQEAGKALDIYMEERQLPKNAESLQTAWLAVKKDWYDKAEQANEALAKIRSDTLVKMNNTQMMYTDDWRDEREA